MESKIDDHNAVRIGASLYVCMTVYALTVALLPWSSRLKSGLPKNIMIRTKRLGSRIYEEDQVLEITQRSTFNRDPMQIHLQGCTRNLQSITLLITIAMPPCRVKVVELKQYRDQMLRMSSLQVRCFPNSTVLSFEI